MPRAARLRLGVAPIDGVLDAVAEPLEGGRGAPFAAFAPEARGARACDRGRSRGAARRRARRPGRRQRAAGAPAEEQIEREPDFASRASRRTPATSSAPRASSSSASRRRPRRRRRPRAARTRPRSRSTSTTRPTGTVLDAPTGAFVAGRALALLGDFRRFDVALVLDTSGSTAESTGIDVNGNGVVGASGHPRALPPRRRPGRLDPRRRGRGGAPPPRALRPARTRGSAVVGFSGTPLGAPRLGSSSAARRGAPRRHRGAAHRTTSHEVRQRAADASSSADPTAAPTWPRVSTRPRSSCSACAAASRSPTPKRQKVVLFLTDGLPSLPTGYESYDVRAVRARRGSRAPRGREGAHLRDRPRGALRPGRHRRDGAAHRRLLHAGAQPRGHRLDDRGREPRRPRRAPGAQPHHRKGRRRGRAPPRRRLRRAPRSRARAATASRSTRAPATAARPAARSRSSTRPERRSPSCRRPSSPPRTCCSSGASRP